MNGRQSLLSPIFVFLLLVVTCTASHAVVYVKWDSAGPTFDGNSWTTAYHTVQAGIDDADIANEEVWVAGDSGHPYVENVVLRDGAALYGGFAGSETAHDQRNWATNVTILDGNQANSVVQVVAGAGLSTVIDGFTVRNGNATHGGGIYCSNASPTITSNRIQDNTASWDGGGLYCGASATPLISENTITGNIATGSEGGGICSNNASPTIRCNTVVQNSTGNAGAGIACSSGGSPVIDRNLIQDNTASGNGGGVHCYYSSPGVTNNIIKGNAGAIGGGLCCNSAPVIANNTFVSNTATGPANGGGGAFCAESTATFLGNIIAFGSSGIGVYNSTLSLSNNCVYGNSADNYSGLSPGPGDISQDPLFVDKTNGNYHLTPISPCIDAGTNSGAPTTDYQGRVRPQDGDGDGTFVCDIGAYEYRVVYVKWDSPGPTLDGKSWATAYHIVQEGLNSAISPDEVWVAAGTYVENITLKDGVGLYGGFAGTETARDQRNWTTNVTILDGNQAGSVVTSPAGLSSSTIIDGFTIRNGNSTDGGGGIRVLYSSPTIRHNIITSNTATDNNGGGIKCRGNYDIAVTIEENRITGNTANVYGSGIYLGNAGVNTVIRNNTLSSNTGGLGAIFTNGGCSPTIAGNVITGNNTQGLLMCAGASPVTNNTIANNANDGVVLNFGGGTAVLSNNIIASNGQAGVTVWKGTGSGVTFRYNCTYGNTGGNYTVVTDPTGTNGNISLDPLFVDQANGDLHLTMYSPCVDSGLNSAPGLPTTDMDGEPRIQMGTVDIGMDEFSPPVVNVAQAKVLPNDSKIAMSGSVITANTSYAQFYVEADDRSSGVLVNGPSGHGLVAGMRADVTGSIRTLGTGERYIAAYTAVENGTGSIEPLALIHRSIGGEDWNYDPVSGAGQRGITGAYGLNNIGLLVTVVGRVTYADTDPMYFYVDDGSALADNSGYTGIKVHGTVPGEGDPTGKYVKVTGISSCFKGISPDTSLYRRIRATEVTVIPEP